MKLSVFALLPVLIYGSSFSQEAMADMSFHYQKAERLLTVSGQRCEYGRQHKNQLPDLISTDIRQYLLNRQDQFIEQIRSVEAGMAGRRLDSAKLALIYQLPQRQIKFDYFFQGNSICARYQGSVKVDFDKNYEDFIELTAPSSYSFISEAAPNVVLNRLQAVYPELDIGVVDSSALSLVKAISKHTNLYLFDYQAYKKTAALVQTGFFIQGENLLKRALSEYLTEYGFTAKTVQEEAYWQLTIAQTDNNELDIVLNPHRQTQRTLRSDPPLFDPQGTDSQQQIQVFKLQLELMDLVEKLK